jgi:hypothetical protein
LIQWTKEQKIVLRAVSLDGNEYLHHLREIRDWDGDGEAGDLFTSIAESLPSKIWMIEVSTPQLFPANERKLGEILLDADNDSAKRFDLFLFARMPGIYLFGSSFDADGKPIFKTAPSTIKSHTPLYVNI